LKPSFLDSISPRRKQLVLWTAAAFLVYTIAGFFLLPPVVRVVTVKQLSKRLNRPVRIQKLRLNPYRFSATIGGLLIKYQDGAPLVSWDEVYVNFQLASFFTHAWVFKEVRLSQPFVSVRVNKDYTLNFSEIVARLSPVAPSGSTASGRCWRIKRLHLTGAKAAFTDLTPRLPFHRTVGPFEVTLLDFRTDPGNRNGYAFSGVTDGGERFSWQGFFSLDPLRSEGELALEGISLLQYAPLYQDLFRFEIQDGVVNLHSTYRYERSAATHLLSITNTTFALKELRVVEKATGQTVIEIPSLVVTGASVDALARQAEASTVTLAGGRFRLRRNHDTSVNALELAKPAAAAPETPGGILLLLRAMTNVVAMLLNTTNLSQGTIGELNLTNCALHLEDLVNSQPVRLDLEGLVLKATNLSNRAGTNVSAEVLLRWNTNGTMRAGIKASVSPPQAEVTLDFDNLNLLPLTPYLEPYLDVHVLGSKLGLAGTLRLHSRKEKLPEVRFQGDAWLDGFATAAGSAAEGLLRCNSLRLSGIAAELNPPAVSVAEAKLEDLFARLVIEPNRTLNLVNALRLGLTNTVTALPSTNTAVTVQPKVSVALLVVSNANLHFIDRSLLPNVNIQLEHLNGTLSGLSSEAPQRAELQLQGTVDKTARAEITGKLNPWNSKQPMDLTLLLKEMDLLPEDPYSGKYLGYRLRKGKLSAQLSYQVTAGRLKAENRLILDQLTLDQKVDSPDATRLPVRLAIALLKNRDGRIALEIPVSGSLDDPQFNLGKVAYRALETVLTRAVTSPFATLSALFGGKGEELSFQDFEPGSTNLLPAALTKLDVLAKGLQERPDLQLELQGSTDPVADLEALRRAKWNQASREPAGHGAGNLFPATSNAPGDAVPAVQSLRKAFAFEKGSPALRYSSTLFNTPTVRESESTQEPLRAFADTRGATALMLIFAPAATAAPDRERELLEGVEIAPEALPTLAVERARNVRAYLLQTGKVEPQRITESAQGLASKGSRVYVRLQ
jgi:hypothetical protein